MISCTIGKFDCGDNSNGSNRCIEYSWVCDGESDCTNNADEELCGMYYKSLPLTRLLSHTVSYVL